MAKLSIAIPDEILTKARQRAAGQGTSVNAVLRNYLGQYAAVDAAQITAAKRVLALSRNTNSCRGDG